MSLNIGKESKMKIFKNRGDIYFSKSGTKADKEQTILIIALVCVILLSVIVVIFTGAKSDFSAKKFFAPDQTVLVSSDSSQAELPDVGGKTNYLLLTTGEDEETVYTVTLFQADMDSISYKICNLQPSTLLDGNTVASIYKGGGVNNLVQALESDLSVDIDFYMITKVKDFISFYDAMGTVHYPLAEDIKYKDSESADTYSVKLSAGEQTLDGKKFISLLRYYVNVKNDCKTANDLVLNGLTQLINSDNAAKKDELFKEFVVLSKSNMTVKDFSERNDDITVLTDSRTGVNTYNVETLSDGGELDPQSRSSIKSYYAK